MTGSAFRGGAYRVRRAIVSLAIVCVALMVVGMTSAAAGPPGLERKLNAAVTGTVNISSGSACGGIVEATTDASLTGSPALGQATIHLEICVTSTVPNDEFFGTFVLTSRLGTITGAVVVSSPDPPGADPQRITGTLTPSGGSGPLARVDGPVAVNVESHGTYPAPVTGTLSVSA
jgi:hypothetical protein